MARLTNQRRRRGLETVEAALLFPLLLLVTFGIIEYGWMFLKQEQLTNITRQAARLAATPDATTTSVNALVTQMMQTAKITGYTAATITPSLTPGSGQLITVTISVPYKNIGLTNVPLLPLPTTLQAQVAMNKEGP